MRDAVKPDRAARLTALIIYIGIVAVLIVRSFIGQGWNDETFCINLAYRFWTGDLPIIDDWGQAQLVGVVLAPVFGMYYSLVGMEGILLFFRMFWLGILVLESLFAYHVIKKYYASERAAYTGAWMLLVFCTQNKALYSYYDLAVRFVILSLLLIICGNRGKKKYSFYLAGVSFVLAVFCNPYLISIYLIMVVLVIILKLIKKGDYLKEALLFTAGCVTIGIPFLIYIFANTDAATFLKCVSYMMNTPGRERSGYVIATAKWVWYIIKSYSIVGIPAQVLLFGYAIYAVLKKQNNDRIRTILYYAEIILGIAYGLIQWFFMDDYCVVGIVFIPLAVWGIMCFILTEKRDWETAVLVGITGILMSLCFQFASDTGIYSIVTGFAVLAVWVPVIVEDFLDENPKIKGLEYTSMLVYALVVMEILFLRVYAYGRTNINDWDFSVKLQQGPSKGIMEDPMVAEIYMASLEDAAYLKSIEEGRVKLLVINSPSKEYLEFEQEECPNNPWISYAEDEYHEYYFQINPDKRPQYIYADIRSGIYESEIVLAGRRYELIRADFGHLYKLAD